MVGDFYPEKDGDTEGEEGEEGGQCPSEGEEGTSRGDEGPAEGGSAAGHDNILILLYFSRFDGCHCSKYGHNDAPTPIHSLYLNV